MTNLTTIELNTLKAEELRTLAKEFQMTGAWKAKKGEMIEFLEAKKSEQIEQARAAEEEVKPQSNRKGRTRTVNVYKDGQLVQTVVGLLETFKWAADNNVCNQGWVKHSLKTGSETTSGRKFKEGGYKFEYAE